MPKLNVKPLTSSTFKAYGEVIQADDEAEKFHINEGSTLRFNYLATAKALGENAEVAISIFRTQPFAIPHKFDLVERHPKGTQAFIPMTPTRFLVIVAPDNNGIPGTPEVFLATQGQGINFFVGTWHGTLTALEKQTDFAIVDRIGTDDNLETFTYDHEWEISDV